MSNGSGVNGNHDTNVIEIAVFQCLVCGQTVEGSFLDYNFSGCTCDGTFDDLKLLSPLCGYRYYCEASICSENGSGLIGETYFDDCPNCSYGKIYK